MVQQRWNALLLVCSCACLRLPTLGSKKLYGWDDEDPTFLQKRNLIKKKYLNQDEGKSEKSKSGVEFFFKKLRF